MAKIVTEVHLALELDLLLKMVCQGELVGIGNVDHIGSFIDAETGWRGENHDAFGFQISDLFKTMDAGLFVLGNPNITFYGLQVPVLITGDRAIVDEVIWAIWGQT
ncbi:UNVERIFIED_CONTAM: hypothetical protein K2H54_069443 [Gekko kuhli]